MIDMLQARLEDVRGAVEGLEFEAPQYVAKLDRVDDTLYELQCEIEELEPIDLSNAESFDEAKTVSGEGGAKDGEKKEIFTPEMKENLSDAGRAIGSVLRDGKEVVSELSGTVGEIKDVFSFGTKKR